MHKCTFPGCTKPQVANGYCAGHYMQVRRGLDLRPLRDSAAMVQISLRLPRDLKRDAEHAAKRDGVDVSEWWRVAGVERLQSYVHGLIPEGTRGTPGPALLAAKFTKRKRGKR